MAFPIRLQHLQRVAGAVTALGCLVLGGSLIAENLDDLRRAEEAERRLIRFHSVIKAVEAISAERGPANGAMDPAAYDGASFDDNLSAKRGETDRAILRVRATFADELAASAPLRTRLPDLDAHLAAARATVDVIRRTAPAQRDGAAIAGAIEAMFTVADDAGALRDGIGADLVRDAPQISTEIILQSAASAMREQTGRLGSYVVMLLTNGIGEREGRAAFDRTAGEIVQIWAVLSRFGHAYVAMDGIRPAFAAVEDQYFGRSWRIAGETAGASGPRTIGAAAFTRLYVPGLDAASRLGDGIDAILAGKLEMRRCGALVQTATSAGLTGAVVAALAMLALVFRQRLFRPLLAVRDEILTVARGDLSEPPRLERADREIREMLDGLTVLREQQRHRRTLERERRRLTRQLRILSETDSLTGLLNRRAGCEHGRRLLDAADRSGAPLGVILLDIDRFKAINDTHGHAAGDEVLRAVALRIRPLLRSTDLIARYGGEEFLIVVPDLELADIRAFAERIRLALSGLPVDAARGLSVSGSFGIATRDPGSGLDWDALVGSADKALYRAKRAGRDRVCA